MNYSTFFYNGRIGILFKAVTNLYTNKKRIDKKLYRKKEDYNYYVLRVQYSIIFFTLWG